MNGRNYREILVKYILFVLGDQTARIRGRATQRVKQPVLRRTRCRRDAGMSRRRQGFARR